MQSLKTKTWRERLYEIIFEADTTAGKLFDVCLLITIVASIVTVSLESVQAYFLKYKQVFYTLEIGFTVLFTIEYILRLIASRRPLVYAKSFYGMIDLISVLPTYLIFFFPQLHYLLLIRSMRLLRVFRVFKMVHFLRESLFLVDALWSSRRKILVFFFFVILLTIVCGSIMFVIESGRNESFHSIPQSIYWAIVTLTTVGYGDISPVTPLGKVMASFIMLLGYCIIAVPTGIVSASMVKGITEHKVTTQTCPNCHKQGHETDATFCKFCGGKL
ncbi:MAG TPA: ion transporter [Flavipsychrobacter sp.]|nr:ion transporter [Flavipsychrobacter sp.]